MKREAAIENAKALKVSMLKDVEQDYIAVILEFDEMVTLNIRPNNQRKMICHGVMKKLPASEFDVTFYVSAMYNKPYLTIRYMVNPVFE